MLSNAQKDDFIHDGFVRVPGLLPPELVATTKANLLAAMGIDERN